MATDNLTKEQVLALAREEWARLDAEKERAKQAACLHARSGTLHDGRRLICDDCGKELGPDDVHYSDSLDAVAQRQIGRMRKRPE